VASPWSQKTCYNHRMSNVILLNGLMNVVFGVVFIFLNKWALQNNFEETFISLALWYGVVVVIGNAAYISIFCKRKL
jgi:hypothetical protein